jgi:trk system potassium uptake protein TrkH
MTRRDALPTIDGDGGASSATSAPVVALWLVTAYLLLIIAGVKVFRSPATMVGGTEMSFPRAVFTSINAATLTGFPQTVAVDQYQTLGQVAIFVLMVAGTYVSLAAGGLAVVRIAGLPYSVARVCTFAAALQLAATIVGGAFLLVPGRAPAQAAFVAASAFGNAGFVIGAPLGGADARALLVAVPLSVLGGLGLPVLMELWDAILGKRRLLSSHTRIVLTAIPTAFLVSFVVYLWLAWPAKTADATRLREAVQAAVTLSLNSRTAGFQFEPMYNYSRAIQWFTMLMMFVGAASAGTGGGLKVTTIHALLRGSVRAIRGGEATGRALGIAVAWTALFFALIFVSLLYFVSNQAQLPGDRALFQIISAASNVGLTHEPLSVNVTNAYVLSAAMLLGRLLPIGVLWWMAANSRGGEEVAVG